MEAPPCQRSDSGASSKAPSDPEALSIHEIARCLPRSRIVVEPLLWTKLQLDLLRCTFSGPCPAPPVIMNLSYPDDARHRTRFERDFFGGGWRADGVYCLLGAGASELPFQSYRGLYFHIGGYRSILLPVTFFCLRNESEGDGVGPAPPVAAYIDHGLIADLRKGKMSRHAPFDLPGRKLAQIKLGRLVSTEPLHEPYLVAILIALAQQQWTTLGQAVTEHVSGVKTKLLYSTDDGDFMHLYSTNVSSALLAMFRDPASTPPAPQSLEIHITAVPYKPLETLRDRLMALLLSATNLEQVGGSHDVIVYKQ